MTDKRRGARRHRVRECQLTYKEGGLSGLLSFSKGCSFPVSDVSQSGCCFVSDQKFDKGAKIKVLLDIPAFVKPLKIDSEVMWCQKMKGYDKYFKIGVKFTKMNREDRSRLNRLDHDTMLHHVRRETESEDDGS